MTEKMLAAMMGYLLSRRISRHWHIDRKATTFSVTFIGRYDTLAEALAAKVGAP